MFGGRSYDLGGSTVRSSQVMNQPANGRSFIQTTIVNQNGYSDNLRQYASVQQRSRIVNLPNYKKTNLGDNSNFIVVFQTIEIERLSNEIELLRVKLKEAERQLFNASNYQVQIKELTEKLFAYESQLQDFRDEYEKLNKICETLYHQNESLKNQLNDIDFSLKQKYESERQKNQDLLQEIEKWKNRYQAGEKSKSKELEDLRSMMESQRKSMIDRQIREMSIRFTNERAGLEGQIRKLREMLNNRDSDIENYKQRCQKYEIEMMELRNNQHIVSELQNQVSLLASELNRLNQLLRTREEEIQVYKKREYELNLKLKEQKDWQNDNQSLRQQLDAKCKEIDEWRSRCSRLDEEATRAKEMMLYNNELSDKLDLASKELDRLNNLLRSKMDQIEKWKQRYSAKEAELTQCKNLENDVATYENKLNMSKAENDRVNGILKSRLEEIEAWKRKNGDLEGAVSRMGLLEKDKRMFEDKFNNQIKNIEELNFALNQLQGENDQLRRAEGRCRDMEAKNDGMARELDRLNQIIRGKEQEGNDNRIKLSRMEDAIKEYKNVEVYLKDLENKIGLMTQENDRLNNLIKDRNDELEQLEGEKIELYSQVNKFKNYEPKMQQNEQTISQLKKALGNANLQLDDANNKIRNAENKSKDLQNNLYSQSQEKEKVNSIARDKTREADQLKNRYAECQNQLRKLPELQNICEQLHSRLLQQASDGDKIEHRCRDLENQLNGQKTRNQDLKTKLGNSASELQRMTNEVRRDEGRKSKEFNDLQENYSRVLTKVKAKDTEIEMLVNKIAQLQNQCAKLMQEFDRLLKVVQKSCDETVALSQRIEEYQDYAKRINILGSEVDRLNKINRGLEDDNKSMRLKYSSNMNFQRKEQQFSLMTVLMAVEVEALRSQADKRQLTEQDMRKSYISQVRKVM